MPGIHGHEAIIVVGGDAIVVMLLGGRRGSGSLLGVVVMALLLVHPARRILGILLLVREDVRAGNHDEAPWPRRLRVLVDSMCIGVSCVDRGRWVDAAVVDGG